MYAWSRYFCVTLFILPLVTFSAEAQEAMVIPRLEGPIVLDGVIDEPAWDAIEPLPLVMHIPSFGEEPTQRTEIRIAHDDDYIYLSAKCFVDDPSKIYATSFRRNHMTPSTDYVMLVLDTFHDNENALAFAVMPTGARLDYTVFNDAVGDMPVNTSWNAFWDAATTRSDEGWFVEMRVPFSSLRFQDEDGRVEMGLIATRWMGHNVEVSIFPEIPSRWGFWSFNKPSKAQTVAFEDVYSRRPLYITPYVLGGMGQNFELNGAGTAYERIDDPTYDLGLDLKYGLTSNLTLDVTLNTDFAQVEADDQQVNLTRFSLFFPEKRLFFQERASIFDFGATERASLFDFTSFTTNRVFYSRRIGLHEGQPVRLLGGARIVGRVGGWDVGLLNMHTGRERSILIDDQPLPSENFGVVRMRRQVFNPYSYVGTILTSRVTSEGQYNLVYGLDGIFRPFGEDYVSLSWAQAFEDAAAQDPASLANARLHAQWERRSIDGFGYELSFSRSGEHYRPEMGFALRENYTRFGDRLFVGWIPGADSPIQRHQLSLNSAVFLRNADGRVESVEIGPSWHGVLNSGDQFQLKAFLFHEDLTSAFSLSDDAEVPAGEYTFYNAAAQYVNFGGPLRNTFRVTAGSFYDGQRLTLSVNPQWLGSRYVQLDGFYGLAYVRFPDRDQSFTGHVARFKVDAALNTRISAAAFVQYNSAIDAVSTNIRVRYNPREGNDLYLVYNEGLNTNRHREDPFLPFTSSRAVMAKYTYTFQF